MTKKIRLICIFSFLITMIVACGERLPIRPMTQARSAITKADSVKASQYAPKEFEASKGKLFECHKFITDEDFDKAKDAANESNELAVQAYNKSIPLLAKDTIDLSRKSLDSANDAYAEKLAPNEYSKAKDEYASANELYQNKQYYKSYKKAEAADASAKEARTVAIGKKSFLKEAITSVNKTLDVAKQYEVEKHAPEKYNLATDNVAVAEEAYQYNELRKGFNAVEVAKMNADDAYLAAIGATAKSKLSEAGVAVENAEKTKRASNQDEIASAKESYGNAKSSLSEQKYKESIESSNEAIRLSAVAMGSRKAGADQSVSDGTEGYSESESGEYTLYKVLDRKSKKDCLWRISEKFYNDGFKWRRIFDANRNKIGNPNLIRPGWILKVPKESK